MEIYIHCLYYNYVFKKAFKLHSMNGKNGQCPLVGNYTTPLVRKLSPLVKTYWSLNYRLLKELGFPNQLLTTLIYRFTKII